MKKFILTLFVATYATAAFAQWTSSTYGYTLNPSSINAGIGNSALSNAKLYLYQGDNTTTGVLYGLNLTTSINNANSTGSLYGAYVSTTKSNTNSAGSVSGVYSTVNSYSISGNVYGTYSVAYNYNSANASAIYGNYIYGHNYNTNGPVYGLYSSVGGGSTSSRYSGYFTGGKFTVMNGNVGIGTTTPEVPLEVNGNVKISGELVISGANSNGGSKAISIVNPSKTGTTQAAIWRLYNMGGTEYGNSFQIWNYGVNGSDGCGNGGLCANRFTITDNGNVGIGTMFPGVKLDVIGTIRAEEVKVCLNQGCDFVFDNGYKLMPLQELNTFITENKHLPEIAPAAVMETEGINLSEMNAKLLLKIEELILYIIELNNRIETLESTNH